MTTMPCFNSMDLFLHIRAHSYTEAARVQGGPERYERRIWVQSQTRPDSHPHHDLAQGQRRAARRREVPGDPGGCYKENKV